MSETDRRSNKRTPVVQVGVRLTPAEAARIDVLVAEGLAREPGIPYTRTSVARSLVLRGLMVVEAAAGTKAR